MTDTEVLGSRPGETRPESAGTIRLDTRRALQLALAGLWLLDGILQFQPYMFTKSFAWMTLGPVGNGDGPGFVIGPAHWVASLVWAHPVSTNAAFATSQVLLGLAIAYRPLLRWALAASIAWALGVWWLAEGLDGLLSWDANPLAGAPGAAVLYAIAAVLLWPSERPARFPAAAHIGERAARLTWLALWGLLTWMMLWSVNRAPDATRDTFTSGGTENMTGMDAGNAGAPNWLAWLENHAGNLAAGRGLGIALAVAVLFALIGLCVFARSRRVAVLGLAAAIVLDAVIWVLGQGLGAPYQGMATDPNSAPVLVLLAAAYWPARGSRTAKLGHDVEASA